MDPHKEILRRGDNVVVERNLSFSGKGVLAQRMRGTDGIPGHVVRVIKRKGQPRFYEIKLVDRPPQVFRSLEQITRTHAGAQAEAAWDCLASRALAL